MLTKIRESFSGWVALTILGLIGITFVFFGVGSYDFLGRSYAAKVDGSEIGILTFEQAYRNQLDNNPTLADLPDEFRVQLRSGVLDSLIRERLMMLYLEDDGYQVDNATVTRLIQQYPEFQVDGKFNMDTYRSWLLARGLEPAEFEENQRAMLRGDQLRRAIGATAVVTPADYRRFLNLVAEKRAVILADFELDPIADDIEITDEMVQAFYDENDTLFLTEESADIEFIEVRRDAVAETIEVSEEQLLEYYEDNQDRYLQDEQRQARHILILSGDDAQAAEAEANALLARIQAGESFETLAAENSDDGATATDGGNLGVLTRSQLPDELGGAIFSMQPGAVEGPVQTDFGFHIVRLDEVLEQGPLPLEQVRGELLTELRQRDAEDRFRDLEGQMSDALFDAPDLQSISDIVGLEVQTVAGFTRAGGEPIGNNQAAIDAVFDASVLYEGQISELIELDANRSAIFKVTQHNEASRQPLEIVSQDIADALRLQEAQTIVFNKSEQLLVAVSDGADFAEAAADAGAIVTQTQLVSRQDTEFDQNVLRQVFAAQKPTQDEPTVGSIVNATGGVTAYNIVAVLPGNPADIPLADRDAGKLELAQQYGQSDYIAFMQALYDRADIEISEDALAADDLF
jgi:peptidyl-prolyl cis-trans isomerase D